MNNKVYNPWINLINENKDDKCLKLLKFIENNCKIVFENDIKCKIFINHYKILCETDKEFLTYESRIFKQCR